MTPSLGSINLLEQITTQTFTSDFQFMIKDPDEQPDKEVHGARSRRVSGTGASVPMGVGWVHHSPGLRMCLPTWKAHQILWFQSF